MRIPPPPPCQPPFMGFGYAANPMLPPASGVPQIIPLQPLPPPPQQFFNPQYPYGVQQPLPKTKTDKKKKKKVQTPGVNKNYVKHPLGILRLLVIASQLGAWIAAACVQNTDYAVRTVSNYDRSVWISMLVFGLVGFCACCWIYLFYVCNIVNLVICRWIPWTVLIAIYDACWMVPMIVLGAFAARREDVNHGDFRMVSLNKGAFGVTAAFGLLSGVLYMLLAIVGFFTLRAPKKT